MSFAVLDKRVRWQPTQSMAPAMVRVRIDLHCNVQDLETEWLRFQNHAAGTFFQTYQWCKAWLDTAGRAMRAQPLVVLGRDPTGDLLFILPFAIRRRQGCRVLEWIGGQQMTYGYGLYDSRFLLQAGTWFATEGWSMLRQLPGVDAIDLAEMPLTWEGREHPLRSWFSLAGPNFSYLLRLASDYEQIYARQRSSETRRGNRKRDTRLMKAAKIEFGLADDRAQMHRIIEDMFDQQRSRLAESGIYGVFNQHERQFVHHLIDMPDHMQPILLPYYLMADGELEAVALGGYFGGGYWALVSSLGSARLRRYSPGDALLRRTIQACCSRGLDFFDFSSGSFGYKLAWADERIGLHHAVRGLTWRGHGWALARCLTLAIKRLIKRTPLLWVTMNAARRVLLGRTIQ